VLDAAASSCTRAPTRGSRPVVPPAGARRSPPCDARHRNNDRDLLHTELRRQAEQLGRSCDCAASTADRLELVARYSDHRDVQAAASLEPATDLDVELTAAARTLADRLLTRRIALTRSDSP